MRFEESRNSYLDSWALMDEMLYRLCAEHIGHGNAGAVNAKVLLIGRTFASGVERHVRSSGTQGSAIGIMCDHILAHHREIDGIVTALRKIKEPLDATKLKEVVNGHGRFCALVSKAARSVLVSFASKYLHFHCPVVPIYDTWASGQAWKMRDKETLYAFDCPPDGNEKYYWYCQCFFQLYKKVLADGANVRSAEYHLMCLATEAAS